MENRQRLLSPSDLVRRWGGIVTEKTLRNWRCDETGPKHSRLGGKVVYPSNWLETWEAVNLPDVKIEEKPVIAEAVLLLSGGEGFFWCEACLEHHSFPTRTGEYRVTFGEAGPTVRPSILSRKSWPRCHCLITSGRVAYMGDCEHDLAGTERPLASAT